MKVPKHKVAEREALQADIDKFFANGKTTNKAKQGKIKPHPAVSFCCNNAAKKKLLKANEGPENQL